MKMSSIKEIDSDLTTDACPSPRRGENANIEEIITEATETSNDIKQNCESQFKYKAKNFKENTKRSPSKPVTKVINIANCTSVQIGKNYHFNINKNVKNEDKEDPIVVKTEAINNLLVSRDPVTTEHIMFVSSHVGRGWRDIGRNLNYSDGQIYQFEETHINKGIKEVVYQLLLDWIQNEPLKATLGKLSDTLWISAQQHVVKMLLDKLKQ